MKEVSLDPSFSACVPESDDHERQICDHCGFVSYDNPKIVVGSVATWEDRILLCRRAIDPRDGFWTLPAGYLEEKRKSGIGCLEGSLERGPVSIGAPGAGALSRNHWRIRFHAAQSVRLAAPDFAGRLPRGRREK